MLVEIKAYRIQCDRCKLFMQSLTDDCIYNTKEEALSGICENDWTAVHIETDKVVTYHLCPTCARFAHKAADKFLSSEKEK